MARRSTIMAKLASEGAKLGVQAEDVLRRMYLEDGKSLAEIGKKLGVTRQAVAYALKQLGVDVSAKGRAPRILKRIRELGYKDLAHYFRVKDRDAPTTFEDMAEELKMSHVTVEKHYAEFLQKVMKAKAHADAR